MRFTVENPDPETVRIVQNGPQHLCHYGDEACAFYPGGPCTLFDCTCETTGHCSSCPQ